MVLEELFTSFAISIELSVGDDGDGLTEPVVGEAGEGAGAAPAVGGEDGTSAALTTRAVEAGDGASAERRATTEYGEKDAESTAAAGKIPTASEEGEELQPAGDEEDAMRQMGRDPNFPGG